MKRPALDESDTSTEISDSLLNCPLLRDPLPQPSTPLVEDRSGSSPDLEAQLNQDQESGQSTQEVAKKQKPLQEKLLSLL